MISLTSKVGSASPSLPAPANSKKASPVSSQSFASQLSTAAAKAAGSPKVTQPVKPSQTTAARQVSATTKTVSAPAAATSSTPTGFNALVAEIIASTPASTPAKAAASVGSAMAKAAVGAGAAVPSTQPYYGADASDDAYWAKKPAVLQQLRNMPDYDQRMQVAGQLISQGYAVDVPVMVWGWDAGKTTALRQGFGYTWVPTGLQASVTAAPGITGGGITPYDPKNPPTGSIPV